MRYITDFIRRNAENRAKKIAFSDIVAGKEYSFYDLNLYSEKLAAWFISLEIKQGDRIGILCRNRVEYFFALFACAKIGAVLVPLNWRSPSVELLPIISAVTPSLLLYGKEDANKIGKLAQDIPEINFDDKFFETLGTFAPYFGRREWCVDEIWYLLYTSGTTGEPKAVIQTYGMAIANYVNISQAIDMRQDDIFLNFLPLFHTAGNNLFTIPALIRGCKSYIIPNFDLEIVVDLLKEAKISAIFGVPNIYMQIAHHANFANIDFSKIRSTCCGGAPLPDYLISLYAERGAYLCNGLGMTETGPTAFIMDKAGVMEKIGSIGMPQILTEVILVDGNYNKVPQGKIGQILFAGSNVTPGYWGNESATNEVFHIDENGKKWLKSGDLARIDEDGYYFVAGRTKEMYISGGENVYPVEIENILCGHPNIREAAIIAIEDKKWGEVGVAYIIPEGEMPSEVELNAFCRAKMSGYKIPVRFIKVDDFPRTPAGKIQKHLFGKI
jgi:fatty-acyl-CoA synthase